MSAFFCESIQSRVPKHNSEGIVNKIRETWLHHFDGCSYKHPETNSGFLGKSLASFIPFYGHTKKALFTCVVVIHHGSCPDGLQRTPPRLDLSHLFHRRSFRNAQNEISDNASSITYYTHSSKAYICCCAVCFCNEKYVRHAADGFGWTKSCNFLWEGFAIWVLKLLFE